MRASLLRLLCSRGPQKLRSDKKRRDSKTENFKAKVLRVLDAHPRRIFNFDVIHDSFGQEIGATKVT